MAPPSVVPWPPMNLVSECTTMSAPYSIGRSRIGVATVLSTISGTPCRGGDCGQRLDVADIAGRIADALAKDRAGLVVDQLLDRVGLIGFGEAHVDALARQNVREQRVGGAVELRHRNDVAAHLGEIEHRVIERRLAGAHAQRVEAAFERGDAALQHGGGRIADAAIADSRRLRD